MIFPGPLNREQRLKTQKNYCIFCALNGVAYMGLGETIIVLFAIKLNAPNGMVASLGAMIYFAFFMLPLGKMVAARVGAARSQSVFWTIRNIVAVGVALAAVTEYCGFHTLALCQILLGACLFYGLRAAGVVMSQPFIGDMATENERAQVLGRSNALFYAGCMCSLSIIWYVLSINESIWVITSIIACSACIGVFSTRYIRRMDESPAMIEAARRSLLPEIKEVWQFKNIRKLLLAMFTSYLAVIMLGASSVLSIKRGYGVSDTAALYFSLIQFVAAAVFSYCFGKFTRYVGSRGGIFIGYGMLLAVALLWLLAPYQRSYLFSSIIFMIIGAAGVICSNALVTYYLQITPERLRVAASMLTSIVTSVGAGVAGIVLSSLIFKCIANSGEDWQPLNRFKLYFAVSFVILAILSVFIWRLPAEKMEKRL